MEHDRGFHAGDAVTVFGVTQTDFALQWMNGQGANGFTGLTLSAAALGKPSARLTLAGYTTADPGNGGYRPRLGAKTTARPI